MGKRELSDKQRKIVNRYYDHRGAIASSKLQELASELFLAEAEGKKTDALWSRVDKALAQLEKEASSSPEGGGAPPALAKLRHAAEARDVGKLAAAAR
ncbi:MAG: hypothetical protein EA378_01710 [Phycisphaerales bacterium]|nr:MAG: hypothetical protein EA378_01710 [Phycisphaerales bacterium]